MKAGLKKYTKKVGVLSIENNEVFLMRIILASFFLLATLYILFIGSMIFDIVERRGLDTQARVLSNEVRDLELRYLSMSGKIDLTLAHSMGFRETKTTFINRRGLSYGLGERTLVSPSAQSDSINKSQDDI
jgi:hypothetical protein